MQKIDWRPRHDKRITGEEQAQIMACGGGDQQLSDEELERIEALARAEPAKFETARPTA
jgi:hypothetical protein